MCKNLNRRCVVEMNDIVATIKECIRLGNYSKAEMMLNSENLSETESRDLKAYLSMSRINDHDFLAESSVTRH